MQEQKTHQYHFYLTGALIGIAYLYYFITGFTAGKLEDPELESDLGLLVLFGALYYIFCVYYFHLFLLKVSNGTYPIKPWKIALFHFIPFYNLYYTYKWPKEVFYFFNFSPDEHMKISKYGWFLVGSLMFLNIEPGTAFIFLFLSFFMLTRKIVSEYNKGNMAVNTGKEAEIVKKLL